MAYTPDFEIAHIGVNCADAAQAERCAEQFAVLFQLAVNPPRKVRMHGLPVPKSSG